MSVVTSFTVRLFGAPRESVGRDRIIVDVVGAPTAEGLLQEAARAHPTLAPWAPHLLVARNRRVVTGTDRIAPDDELAFLPPVSGGAVSFVRDRLLSMDAALARLRHGTAGAAVGFLGIARPDEGTTRLELEAYEEMAAEGMAEIERVAREKFGLIDIMIEHRLGAVPVGEAVVLVAVTARHRREAFDGASWTMDEIKRSVPIWKKEVSTAGDRWIHRTADSGAAPGRGGTRHP
ncbi:MAG: molybdenum cofactor biosynthesis protein MoaE [Thermoplasmatota archaeon]